MDDFESLFGTSRHKTHVIHNMGNTRSYSRRYELKVRVGTTQLNYITGNFSFNLGELTYFVYNDQPDKLPISTSSATKASTC